MRGLLVLLLLAGCSRAYDPSWTRIRTQSGRPGFIVECRRTPGCVEMAGDVCPHGYRVLETGRDADYDPREQRAENALAAMANRWPAHMGKSIGYAIVECASRAEPSAEPPRVTVTRNAPPTPPKHTQSPSSLSSGLEEE